MAKLQEEVVLIKVSRLVTDDAVHSSVVDNEVLEQLEALLSELAGPKSIVEIEKLDSAK